MKWTLCFLLIATQPMLANTVVTTRAIRAETVITGDDLVISDAVTPGALTQLSDAIGLEALVTIYPGRPILVGDLAEPAIIERNQVVEMRYSVSGLSIMTEGRVLDRARVGDRVRILNLTSRTTVWGEAMPEGWIEVGQ